MENDQNVHSWGVESAKFLFDEQCEAEKIKGCSEGLRFIFQTRDFIVYLCQCYPNTADY